MWKKKKSLFSRQTPGKYDPVPEDSALTANILVLDKDWAAEYRTGCALKNAKCLPVSKTELKTIMYDLLHPICCTDAHLIQNYGSLVVVLCFIWPVKPGCQEWHLI